MVEIAKTFVTGPEAKGPAVLFKNNDGSLTVRLSDFWVAPGAPDVHVALTTEVSGRVNQNLIDIGQLPYTQNEHTINIPNSIDVNVRNVLLVYCKQFSAHFGHGVLEFE